MHVNDGPCVFHVTNIRVALDVGGSVVSRSTEGESIVERRIRLLFFAVPVIQLCLG